MSLSSVHLGKGWATFGLCLPQYAATTLQIGSLPTQTDVKVRWSDGSTRFAILTVWSPADADYLIDAGPQTSGAFTTPSYPTASVVVTIAGEQWVSDPNHATVIDSWLFGVLVREYRVLTPLLSVRTQAPHPSLQVLYDSRIYHGGIARVDVTLQNVVDVTPGASVTYDVSMRLNGTQVYARSRVVHGYLQRWHKVFSTKPLAAVQQDLEPFYVCGAMPRFLATVVDPTYTIDPVRFAPLGYGDMSADMAGPGGRPEIGPYPNWVAQYLVHQRPEQKAYMLASADASGSWRGHITEPDGLTLISLDTMPLYWLDGRSGTNTVPSMDGYLGPNATRVNYQGGPWPGGWSWPIDNQHVPSHCYVPYLLTGDRFYLDQMKFYANFTMLSTWPGDGHRQAGKGILTGNAARAIGWCLRNLVDVAAYIPDADPMASYFRTRVQFNLDALEQIGSTAQGGFTESLFNFGLYGGTVTSLWGNSYVGWALDHAAAQGFGPVASMRDRIARTQVKFYTSESEGYPRTMAAPYYPLIGQGPLFTTMQQIADGSNATDPTGNQSRNFYPEARLMLQIGAREGIPGAHAALAYLLSILGNDVNSRSGFAVLP